MSILYNSVFQFKCYLKQWQTDSAPSPAKKKKELKKNK